MRKVYFISVDTLRYVEKNPAEPSHVASDFFFVVGEEGPEEAEAHLREQIKKHYFKVKLANKSSDSPKRLGERILVDDFITEATADAPLEVEDVTPMAYVYGEAGVEYWKDWAITLEEANA